MLLFTEMLVLRVRTTIKSPKIKLKLVTECPRINRKSVLHLLKYTENIHLSRCSTDLRLLLGHLVSRFAFRDQFQPGPVLSQFNLCIKIC